MNLLKSLSLMAALLIVLLACGPEAKEAETSASGTQAATASEARADAASSNSGRRSDRRSARALSKEQRAAVRGKYSGLLSKVTCPSKQAEDRENYGEFGEAGHYDAVEWCDKSFPAAYWVWVDGSWFLWKTKNLETIGFTTSDRQVQLSQGALTLHFEHHKKNAAWAAEQLKWLAAAMQEMERFTGLPYPGNKPYPIEENPDLPLLGLAGPNGMQLISPPKGTLWTMLHETVHIWNAGIADKYVCEGLANFVSYLMMEKFRLPFAGDETYPAYIAEWREIQGEAEDYSLDTHYDELPQGKAMAFWAMAYEIGGPALIKEAFVTSVRQASLSVPQLKKLLAKHGVSAPDALLSGWVVKGPYQVEESADAGEVRFPLAKAWP